MESLRKRGKEKLRFRKMSFRVPNRDFKYFKRFFLECLSENKDITNSLTKYYRRIQIFFSTIGKSLMWENQLEIC
ncbi:hypothetical protein MCGE09_00524 [Thaumarchaeota archaeon SCGC AB-539-E09]|nr:hypothetical protein MCGE09_00524 [Thaumarchaeota archaeon SCGC AB-539-E09]